MFSTLKPLLNATPLALTSFSSSRGGGDGDWLRRGGVLRGAGNRPEVSRVGDFASTLYVPTRSPLSTGIPSNRRFAVPRHLRYRRLWPHPNSSPSSLSALSAKPSSSLLPFFRLGIQATASKGLGVWRRKASKPLPNHHLPIRRLLHLRPPVGELDDLPRYLDAAWIGNRGSLIRGAGQRSGAVQAARPKRYAELAALETRGGEGNLKFRWAACKPRLSPSFNVRQLGQEFRWTTGPKCISASNLTRRELVLAADCLPAHLAS